MWWTRLHLVVVVGGGGGGGGCVLREFGRGGGGPQRHNDRPRKLLPRGQKLLLLFDWPREVRTQNVSGVESEVA